MQRGITQPGNLPRQDNCSKSQCSPQQVRIKHCLHSHSFIGKVRGDQGEVPRAITLQKMSGKGGQRITEWFGLEGIIETNSFQLLCHGQGHLPLHQQAQTPQNPGMMRLHRVCVMHGTSSGHSHLETSWSLMKIGRGRFFPISLQPCEPPPCTRAACSAGHSGEPLRGL